jgi:hypothetical protein
LEGVGDRYTGAKAKGHATIKIDAGLTVYVRPTIWRWYVAKQTTTKTMD